MFIEKTFLLALFIPIGLYSFSLFEKESSSDVSVSKPIYIEPIVIPKSVKEESNVEILKKLKEATKEAFENAEPSDDEIADEVLRRLRALAKSRELEKEKALVRKKELEKKKALARKKELEKKKALARKRELEKKKALARKKELEKKKALARKRELEKKKALFFASKIELGKVSIEKKNISLGEQQDIHTLSKEEEKKFHNLEVVSVSKPFVLEDKPKIKSPKKEEGVQAKIELDNLPWVETLGVINVSKPFLKN